MFKANLAKKEKLRQRKWDKVSVARSCLMSSVDSLSICCRIPLKRKAWIPVSESQAPSLSSRFWRSPGHHQLPGTLMWTLHPENVIRRTPRRGNEDEVGRWTDQGITTGTVLTGVTGMSVAHSDQNDGSQSTVDTGHAGSRSLSRSRATAEQKCSAGAKCCEDQSTTSTGSAGAGSSGSRLLQTGLSSDGAFSSWKLQGAWSAVVLGLFLAGFRLLRTRF